MLVTSACITSHQQSCLQLQVAPVPAPLPMVPAPAPSLSTSLVTLNLGGAQITAPLTAQQQAAVEGVINKTIGSLPGVAGVSVSSVQVLSPAYSSITPSIIFSA